MKTGNVCIARDGWKALPTRAGLAKDWHVARSGRPDRGVDRRCAMCHAPRAPFACFRSFRQAVAGIWMMIDAVTPA
jgi:hypothetical protein